MLKRKIDELYKDINVLINENEKDKEYLNKLKNELSNEKLKNSSKENEKISDIEELITCPITMEKFVIPITIHCGHTFEHYAIKRFLLESYKCPVCNAFCEFDPFLKPNISIIDIIEKLDPKYRNNKNKELKKTKEYEPTFLNKKDIPNSDFENKLALDIMFKEFVYTLLKPLSNPNKTRCTAKKENLKSYTKYIVELENDKILKQKVNVMFKSENTHLKYNFNNRTGILTSLIVEKIGK